MTRIRNFKLIKIHEIYPKKYVALSRSLVILYFLKDFLDTFYWLSLLAINIFWNSLFFLLVFVNFNFENFYRKFLKKKIRKVKWIQEFHLNKSSAMICYTLIMNFICLFIIHSNMPQTWLVRIRIGRVFPGK